MIDFIDRVPATGMSNKKTIEHADGTSEVVTITFADNASVVGTPINRANLMAIQGFVASTTEFDKSIIAKTHSYGDILEKNSAGDTLVTIFGKTNTGVVDATIITEVFTGKNSNKSIIKTTKFNTDGSISVTIS